MRLCFRPIFLGHNVPISHLFQSCTPGTVLAPSIILSSRSSLLNYSRFKTGFNRFKSLFRPPIYLSYWKTRKRKGIKRYLLYSFRAICKEPCSATSAALSGIFGLFSAFCVSGPILSFKEGTSALLLVAEEEEEEEETECTPAMQEKDSTFVHGNGLFSLPFLAFTAIVAALAFNLNLVNQRRNAALHLASRILVFFPFDTGPN